MVVLYVFVVLSFFGGAIFSMEEKVPVSVPLDIIYQKLEAIHKIIGDLIEKKKRLGVENKDNQELKKIDEKINFWIAAKKKWIAMREKTIVENKQAEKKSRPIIPPLDLTKCEKGSSSLPQTVSDSTIYSYITPSLVIGGAVILVGYGAWILNKGAKKTLL